MDELKYCPFCGNSAKLHYRTDIRDMTDWFQCECENELCGAAGGWARKREWAIKRWNKRCNDDGKEE